MLYDELGENYLPMVADGFVPPGRITGGANTQEEILSAQAQFGTLLMRIAMWAVELLLDETVTGCDEKSLWDRLYGTEEVNENPDAPERLPDIQVIRQMLLPAEDQGIAGHLKSRLGFIGNDPNWPLWREKVTELLNGVEFLSSKLASEPTAIEEESIILLNKKTKHFEDLS